MLNSIVGLFSTHIKSSNLILPPDNCPLTTAPCTLHPAPYFLEAKASIIRSYEYHKNNAIDTIFFMGDDAATID
jgi:hypothetical protein